MEPSAFKISVSVESYDEKTAENYQNYYVAEKPIVFKLSKIPIPNYQSYVDTLWLKFRSQAMNNFC